MNNCRRCRMEIMNELISLSVEGVKKTHLLYKCNLSYSQLTRYLDLLLENDVLTMIDSNENGTLYRKYMSTEKGLLLLEDLNKVLSYFNP